MGGNFMAFEPNSRWPCCQHSWRALAWNSCLQFSATTIQAAGTVV